MVIRKLHRDEIHTIWTLDRSEVIESIYYHEDGALILRPECHQVSGWPPAQREQDTPILLDCFERGGTFYGAFQNSRLIGVAVLDNKLFGPNQDHLQLKFLYTNQVYRKQGVGRRLFMRAVEKAQAWKARRLYISATPSENTVNFYLNLGCTVMEKPDQALFELEPEDIHLEYVIS